MNGADALIQTAVRAGAEVCFSNPGTTELPLVAALDRSSRIRGVLGLFEGVCTGAADGYARMAGRPALTLLHLGPGFANGIANLHNARRAHSPIVNLVGDHASWHLAADAPLTSDIESLAAPVSAWLRKSRSAETLAADFAEAWGVAAAAPGRVSTLIAPADCQWNEAPGPAAIGPLQPAPAASGQAIAGVAKALRNASRPALLLGGPALRAEPLRAAAAIAAAHGARLLCETFPARLERGAGLPAIERLAYFPEQAAESLAELDVLVLVGCGDPVAFFGYPGLPSRLRSDHTTLLELAGPQQDCAAALATLRDELGALRAAAAQATPRPQRPGGALDAATLGAAVAALQPEHSIVVDEAISSGLPYFMAASGAPPHSYLALTGGAIGQGLPCATGAAVACPDRQVIALQADGSAAYTAQSLWTQAREGLNVITLLCANRAYRILQVELARAGIPEPGPAARSLTDLSRPDLDWVKLAAGFGVPGVRVETTDALNAALERGFAEPGPRLIEVAL